MSNYIDTIANLSIKSKIIIVGIIAVLFLVVVSFSEDKNLSEQMSKPKMDAPEAKKEVKLFESKMEALNLKSPENNSTLLDFTKENTFEKSGVGNFNQQNIDTKNEELLQVKALEKAVRDLEAQELRNFQASVQQSNQSIQTTKSTGLADENAVKQTFLNRANKNNQGFFSSNPKKVVGSSETSSSLFTDPKIYAVVDGNQDVYNRGRLRMRLVDDYTIDGVIYPENTFFYGFVSFEEQRILISVNTIKGNEVQLNVYDAEDSNLGVHTTIQFKNLAEQAGTDEVIDQIPSDKSSGISVVKSLLKNNHNRDKAPFINNQRMLLKPNQ